MANMAGRQIALHVHAPQSWPMSTASSGESNALCNASQIGHQRAHVIVALIGE